VTISSSSSSSSLSSSSSAAAAALRLCITGLGRYLLSPQPFLFVLLGQHLSSGSLDLLIDKK